MLIGAAAGKTASNAVTYGGMLVRGLRAAPYPRCGRPTRREGVDLPAEGEEPDDPTAQNRQSGLGVLLGFSPSLGLGAAYGFVRPHLGGVSTLHAGLGLAAMAGDDGPMVAPGITDPRRWDLNGWLSDLVPHLATARAGGLRGLCPEKGQKTLLARHPGAKRWRGRCTGACRRCML